MTGDRERSRALSARAPAAARRVPLAARRAAGGLVRQRGRRRLDVGQVAPAHARGDARAGGRGARAGRRARAHAAELEALLETELAPRLEQLRRLAESADTPAATSSSSRPSCRRARGLRARAIPPTAPDLPRADERPRDLRALVRAALRRARARAVADRRADHRPRARLRRASTCWATRPQIAEIAPRRASTPARARRSRARSTPLRLAEGESDGGAALGDTVRLVDLLGADAREPARAPAPRPRRMRCACRSASTPRASCVELDLKQAAEDGMGPHGRARRRHRLGQERAAALARRRPGRDARPRGARVRARRLQGRRGVRRARRGSRTSPGMITNLQRDLTLVDRMRDGADRRAGAPPVDAARRRATSTTSSPTARRRDAAPTCRRCPTCW